MIGIDFAKNGLTNAYCSSPPWTFIELYTALDAAWLQEQRQKSLENYLERSEPKPIFWESQGFYGNHRKKTPSAPGQNFKLFKTSINVSFGPKKRFYNCIEIVHYYLNCHRSRTMKYNVNKIINSSKRSKSVI